jgi:hypothetical protein
MSDSPRLGSSDRQRDGQPRPDSGRKHRTKHGGRQLGAPNKMTTELKEAVIEAAQRVGSDLKGKDGLVGYLMRLGQDDPKMFGTLLRAVLPLQINWKPEIEEKRDLVFEARSLQEAEAHLRSIGLPVPFWLAAYYNGELEALAAQLEKELSLEVKLLPEK